MLSLLFKRALSLRGVQRRSNLVGAAPDCFAKPALGPRASADPWARNDGPILIFKPARWNSHGTVPGEDGIDLGHISAADLPAERASVFTHFSRRAKTDQRRADDWVAQCPAQCELRQALAIFGRERPQLLDSGKIAWKVFRPEQTAERVEAAKITGL